MYFFFLVLIKKKQMNAISTWLYSLISSHNVVSLFVMLIPQYIHKHKKILPKILEYMHVSIIPHLISKVPHFLYFSCTFHSVGTAAGEQKFNSLCVLSLNIINEKIYILIWFWMFFITSMTGLHLIYRLFTIMMPYSR